MVKNFLIFSLSLIALIFTACSSDSEDAMGTGGMHEYSADEIQQIQKLQEEYGVSFTYPTKSNSALPNMKEIEDICKIAASLQSSTRYVQRKGNLIYNVRKSNVFSRGFSQGKEYSGKDERYGDLGMYGFFYYTATWTGTSSEKTNVIIDVKQICNRTDVYDITYKRCEASFSGAYHINFTIYFNVYDYLRNKNFEIRVSDSINLESGH